MELLIKLLQIICYYAYQIHAFARKEYHSVDSAASDSSIKISDIPIAAFGSRAHLEEKALATVQSAKLLTILMLYALFLPNLF